MNIFDICKAYAELNERNMLEVWEEYNLGVISKHELFDAFLQYEGIIGYTDKIITAFRICWELN